jgi:hypothetical protein
LWHTADSSSSGYILAAVAGPAATLHPSTPPCLGPQPPPLPSSSHPADAFGKFAASAWGKKLARQAAKAATSDFDRYKAGVQKAKRSRAIRKAMADLK